eukprot:291914-Pelagomonas_calceolata.AAC.1
MFVELVLDKVNAVKIHCTSGFNVYLWVGGVYVKGNFIAWFCVKFLPPRVNSIRLIKALPFKVKKPQGQSLLLPGGHPSDPYELFLRLTFLSIFCALSRPAQAGQAHVSTPSISCLCHQCSNRVLSCISSGTFVDRHHRYRCPSMEVQS